MAKSVPQVGQNWSGYLLRRLRGVGSFGQVWEAGSDAAAGEVVALKTIACQNGLGVHELRNVQNVCPLKHANLIRIDKVWCEDQWLVVVMELADGSLHDLLEISRAEFGRALSARTLLDFFQQAAAALDFLNSRRHFVKGRRVGIQHRDIKPSNLLMVGNRIKLCDFGVSTLTSAAIGLHNPAGTTAFAAPEVFRGELSDWTDQYALAASYCYLRGAYPFPDPPATFDREYIRPAPDLGKLDPTERPILMRALAPTPQDRWDTCDDMFRALLRNVCQVITEPPIDRRHGVRQSCPLVSQCRIMMESAPDGMLATVVDVSKSGIGLLLDRALAIDSKVTIVVPRPGAASELISAQVVRSLRKADGKWFAGCRFGAPVPLKMVEVLSTPTRVPASDRL